VPFQRRPLRGLTRPLAVLAERVEGLVSQEHSAWSAHRPTPVDAGRGDASS
jgi:hypothetical protein